MTTYPIGTNLRDIKTFDRSTKVVFACTNHPDIHFMSKDPFCSNWFPGNQLSEDIDWGKVADPCSDTFKTHAGWVTVTEYTS